MLVTLGLVALAVFAIDQIAKHLVTTNLTLGEDVPVLGDVLILHYVKNPGAAFSLASGSTWIFSIIAAVVVVAVICHADAPSSANSSHRSGISVCSVSLPVPV